MSVPFIIQQQQQLLLQQQHHQLQQQPQIQPEQPQLQQLSMAPSQQVSPFSSQQQQELNERVSIPYYMTVEK